MKQHHMQKLVIFILSLWLGMTFAVDFVAIPQAFRTIPSREIAGQLGIKVFSLFNRAELVFGLIVVSSFFWPGFLCGKRKKIHIVIGIVLLALASSYLFYISPNIGELSRQMNSNVNPEVLQSIEAQHDFFHWLYVKLDGLKILLLLTGIFLQFSRSEEV